MGSLSRGTKADQFSYVPAGTVLPFAGNTAPSGWAICNGDTVSRTDYAELFTAIGELWGVGDGSTTFNLPDMRGQFLRGLDTTEGVDPDFATRIVGSSQVDEFESHTHTTTLYTNSTGAVGGGQIWVGYQTVDTGSTGGNETRPKNVAVNYIIKL
jgi:microcystin-dependent protein